MKTKLALLTGILLASVAWAQAGETVVAVAANFTEPVKEIAEQFKAKTGHTATLSFGATGNFYNQIKNGAPFEVFLAADTARPTKAVEEGYAVKGTEFTYAAPYGKASVETLDALKVHDKVKDKLVEGQNISQAYQFVKTGNAEIGFVALSQIINEKGGSKWIVPQDYYNPIRQDAVLLKTGENNEAAKAFMDFLKGPEAATIIKKYGYALPEVKQ